MLVFIDESGCPGFKLTKGSSAYFIVAMTIFKDSTEAELASKAIADLRQALGIATEFKFSKAHSSIRDKFFHLICKHDFKIKAIIINKSEIYSSKLRKDNNAFYNYFVKMLMQHDHNILNHASIKIDGSGDKEFKKQLTSYLRRYLGENKIKKFRFVNSERDNLIQLADMNVGAIARSLNTKRKDASKWLNILVKTGKIKQKDIWEFQ